MRQNNGIEISNAGSGKESCILSIEHGIEANKGEACVLLML